ncbi:MAG: dihydroorotase [Chloroflexi bacterium]|nr:dihydroorotase [Chloroflexota bacterium]
MFLLIRGGRIINPSQGIDRVGDLLIAGGKIVQIGGIVTLSRSPEHSQETAQNLDATGLVICPGFIDLHCHLREPGFEDKETIATGTKAAAIGGFTTVCCMANTEPPLDDPAAVDWLKRKASQDGLVAVLPIGCITNGRRGEELTDMAALARAGVVGFSDDGNPVANSQLMRRALEYSRDLGLPIIDHCEDKTLSNNGVINEGQVSAKLGLKGIPAAAEEVMVARDLILAKLTKARLHIAHVSTKGSVELIRRAKEEGISVTAEVTPHHLTLTEERIAGESPNKPFDTNAKVNPPLRTKEDVEALIKGLRDSVIDAIATDHAPHTLIDKNCPLELAAFGISGLETALGCLMSLVHRGEISLAQLISKLTYEPAKVIGRNGELGTLKAGAPANITIFDPDREWVVDSHNFASKGKNTPYDGYRFKGKVMATIANGRIVYMDDLLRRRFASIPCHSERTPCHSERSEESHG